MSKIETSEKSGWGKPVAVLTAVAALGAGWIEAEKIAKWAVGDYEGSVPQVPVAPSLPVKPQPKPAQRQPIEVAIGFDNSRSAIRNELPNVVSATREFLQKTDSLGNGDTVDICTFVESASCEEFKLPDRKDALLNYVSAIQVEPQRPMETYVHSAVEQIVEQTSADLVLVWTDADDETKGEKRPLKSGHAPVTIVVPQEKYMANAQEVRTSLGRTDVDVELARTSDDFGRNLEILSGELAKEAQEKAQAEAGRIHQGNLAKYQADLAQHAGAVEKYQADQQAYEAVLKDIEEKRATAEAEVTKWKTRIKIAVGSILAIFAGLVGLDLYQRNRPKVKGFIVDRRDQKYPRVYRLSPSKEPYRFRRIPGNEFTLTPTKNGISDGTKILKDGDQVSPGIYYYATEPSRCQQ